MAGSNPRITAIRHCTEAKGPLYGPGAKGISEAQGDPRAAPGGGEGGQAVRGAAAQPPGAKASLLHPQQRRPRVVACDSGVTSIEKPPIVLVHTGF